MIQNREPLTESIYYRGRIRSHNASRSPLRNFATHGNRASALGGSLPRLGPSAGFDAERIQKMPS